METIFAFLFKYRPFFFREGDFAFQNSSGSNLILFVLAIALGLTWWIYWKSWVGSKRPGGWRLPLLRTALLVLLAILTLRPTLILSSIVPRESLLGLLVDNSLSMGIPEGSLARGEPVSRLLQPETEFTEALEEKFFLRPYRFGGRPEAAPLPLQLDWTADRTDLAAALQGILDDSRNLPLGAVVVVSDGADNSFRSFEGLVSELQSRNIPVYTVGVGPEQISQDVEISDISTSRMVLPKSVTMARITLRQNGFDGARSRLEVRDGTTLVQTTEVYFTPAAQTVSVEVALQAERLGIRNLEFFVQPLEGERILENNRQNVVIDVVDSRPRILYVEGRPRWEYKFIRQAVEGDESLRLETLLRTALNKFYRQGIEEETTLAAGFPSGREELFEYRGIMVGSVESSFFTVQQLELIRDFVGKRGGGFLMLGGSHSFSSGNYQNTPLEQVLPVWLDPARQSDDRFYAQGEGQLRLGDAGQRHPALALTVDQKKNQELWDTMPVLTDWNRVRELKSGTTVLASLASPGEREVPLLSFQRFGRGYSAALLTGSSWRWQMLRDVEDRSHETFWRQMLRWLVSQAKDRVSVETERPRYSRQERVEVRAEVSDAGFTRINNARVEAVVAGPDGREERFPLRWTGEEDGLYKGDVVPLVDGLHTVTVSARRVDSDEDLGGGAATFTVETGRREYFEAFQRVDFLRRLAEQTGGRYYTLENVDRLPEEIVYKEGKGTTREVLDLWDMPINLIMLLGLMGMEWVLRKRYGTI